MMKLFGLAAAAVCLLALAGCGGQSGGEAGYTKEQVQTILDSGAFTDELDELDCDTAWALLVRAFCTMALRYRSRNSAMHTTRITATTPTTIDTRMVVMRSPVRVGRLIGLPPPAGHGDGAVRWGTRRCIF